MESQNRTQTTPPPTTRLRASLIVSTWNGRHLLETCLPPLLAAVEREGRDHEIIVVDDASGDDTVEFMRREFPQVLLLPLKWNHRFAGANNAAARVALGDILIFLNNDMLVEPDFIEPLLRHFADPEVFAVTAYLQMEPRQTEAGLVRETGLVRGRFEQGLIVLRHEDPTSDEAIPVIYAGGGSSAWRRDRFLQLGGFDTLFRPFYFEDLDVSYRAQKLGWRVLFEPASRVEHKHRQTNNPSNFPGSLIEVSFQKNYLLFMWKVLTDPAFVSEHFRGLRRMLADPQCNPRLRRGFLRATRQLPALLWKRHRARRGAVLTDREAFARASVPPPPPLSNLLPEQAVSPPPPDLSPEAGENEQARARGVPPAAWERRTLHTRLRATAIGAARLLAKATIQRRGVARWGLEAAEPPHRALIMVAGTLPLAGQVAEEIRRRYPHAELAGLAPAGLAKEMVGVIDAPVIAVPCLESGGYRLTWALVQALYAGRFDTIFVAGEGSRRAEIAALLTSARKVEVREDGAAHVFSLAPWKPIAALVRFLARGPRALLYTALVGLVWGALTMEGWVWQLRRRGRRAEGTR